MASEYEDFRLSISIAEDVQAHLAFLEYVDNNSAAIHERRVVENAIRRYEKFWLPLLAQHDPETVDSLEPPDDIHWVWHVHMLCPRKYVEDCKQVIYKVPGHKFLFGSAKDMKKLGRKRAKGAWRGLYHGEPFDVDIDSLNRVPSFKSKISYDIAAASERQKNFYYNVSLPHFRIDSFLQRAAERYQKFVNLKKLHQEAFIVPMYDVDLIWHTHQLNPTAYVEDTEEFLGFVLDHDDSVADRGLGSKLNKADSNTRNLWRSLYYEEFAIQGVMYRGIPPRACLDTVPEAVIKEIGTVGILRIENIEVSGALKSKTGLSGYFVYNSKKYTLAKKKHAPFNWRVYKELHYDTTLEDIHLVIQLQKLDGIKGKLFGISCDWLAPRINLHRHIAETLEKVKLTSTDAQKKNGPAASMHMSLQLQGITCDVYSSLVESKSKGPQFRLILGMFESGPIAEDDIETWGPVPLPKSLPGIENICSFAKHRVMTSTSVKLEFDIKVIHSLPMRMSVVQVFYKGNMVVVSHVIGSEQLPHPNQVSTSKYPTLDTKKGETVFLIKNSKGDWGIVRAAWTGFKRGRAKTAKRPAVQGDPGYLTGNFFNLKCGETYAINIKKNKTTGSFTTTFSISDLELFDLQDGDIIFQDGSEDIPEHIALGFSITLLFMMCKPQPRRPEVLAGLQFLDIRSNHRRISNQVTGSMKVLRAMGFETQSYPSNSWYYWYKQDKSVKLGGGVMLSSGASRLPGDCDGEERAAFLYTESGGAEADDADDAYCPWNPDSTTTTDDDDDVANLGDIVDDLNDDGEPDDAGGYNEVDVYGDYGGACGADGGGGGLGGYDSDEYGGGGYESGGGDFDAGDAHSAGGNDSD